MKVVTLGEYIALLRRANQCDRNLAVTVAALERIASSLDLESYPRPCLERTLGDIAAKAITDCGLAGPASTADPQPANTKPALISKPPHGNAKASASGSPEHGTSRLADGRGGNSQLVAKLREYADYRATPDDLSKTLYRAADALEATQRAILEALYKE